MSDKYASLRQALDAAHEQASQGKGKERHALNNEPFVEQPIMAITRMVGLGYPCGQAMKKLQEAVGMAERGQHEAAQREMLGAINYAAAAWIRVGEMVGADLEGSDGRFMAGEVRQDITRLRHLYPAVDINNDPPVPWEDAPRSVRYITRDANGAIDAWEKDRPVLEHGAVWCGSGVDLIRWRESDGGQHKPKIWERSAADEEAPPVPWDQVPDAFKYITRDTDGTIEAWTESGPERFGQCLFLRGPDCNQHEPKIWERPKAQRDDEQPPVPWEHAPPRVRYYTRDGDGRIDAWSSVKPVLRGSVWCGPWFDGEIELTGEQQCEPKIWERPAAAKDDEPPVPWSEVPEDAKWITRDAYGMIEAWSNKRPGLMISGMWFGELSKCRCLRWPDGGRHEPKIWERPTDD